MTSDLIFKVKLLLRSPTGKSSYKNTQLLLFFMIVLNALTIQYEPCMSNSSNDINDDSPKHNHDHHTIIIRGNLERPPSNNMQPFQKCKHINKPFGIQGI